MSVTHIVMLQFKPDVSSLDVEEVCQRMLGLKEGCIHPETKKPYIKSLTGGKDISNEGLQNGYSHSFVAIFENVADRDYYCQKDPHHSVFAGDIGKCVQNVQVLDFAC
ncbi:stress responsive A/B barrel domain-containing protein [Aspergillus steynii IBT 23096]|uniref:Stress responsive A/B barrel domain-containing protein n=1 Tax=Aspergillus steynii IBT 23096 TaxID=1392250 RepID=A0A2I2FW85_9EURO|nr:stress responsive A/B barrel domain-containing protein [Aspergillus steynii IBT 23096]PLB44826.1 stress responsive A/B barrel domain-containing protein [Aspergillus steynii IBT 23096]